MAGGFLNRWSRRKAGETLEPEQADKQVVAQSTAPTVNEADAIPAPPLASLEDVDKIDRFAPDFSAFMQPGVDPAVQQAALKKMFSDPHFNVMDGLDIYIDDYSKPDPIPLEMLKRMVQSDMLNIFRKEDGSPIEEENASGTLPLPDSESKQTLPLRNQTDLTSIDRLPTEGIDQLDSTPVDKKTS